MAGGTEFKIEFKAVADSLKKATADLRKLNQEQAKAAALSRKQDSKANKERFKEFEKYTKLVQKDLKMRESGHSKVLREQRKAQREELSFNKKRNSEEDKRRKEEDRRRIRGRRGGGMFSDGSFQNVGQRAGRAGMGILGMGVGMAVGGAQAGYQRYLEYGQALGGTIGLGSGVGRGIRNARGSRLGFSQIDTAQQVPMMARSTGVVGPRELQQAQRATAMDAGEVSGVFQTLRQSGASFRGGEFSSQSRGGREFAKMVASGTASGLEKGRIPEFAEGVTTLMQRQMGVSAGDVNQGPISALLTAMGKTGLAGFQGSRGAAVAGKLQNAFMNPGGGEWGKSAMMRSMGFGSGATFREAEMRRERGISDPDNIRRLVGQAVKEHGGEADFALRAQTGLGLEQSQELIKMFQKGELSVENLKKIEKLTEGAKSLEEQSLDEMKENGGILQRIAERTDEFIAIGREVTPLIEAVEDVEMEILKALMGILDVVKPFYSDFKEALNYWFGMDEGEAKAAFKAEQERKKQIGISPIDQARINAESYERQRARESEITGAMGAEEQTAAIGKNLFGKDVPTPLSDAYHKEERSRIALDAANKVLMAKRKKSGISLDAPFTDEEKQFLRNSIKMGESGTKSSGEISTQLKIAGGVSGKDIQTVSGDIKRAEGTTKEQATAAAQAAVMNQKRNELDAAKATREIVTNINNSIKPIKVEIDEKNKNPARPKAVSKQSPGKADRVQ